jgi:hypothetical protein
MQHVHGIRELCDVDDTPFAFHVNPYFVRSGSNCHHRLKVGRHHATLNSIQFEAGMTASIAREVTQIIQSGANEQTKNDACGIEPKVPIRGGRLRTRTSGLAECMNGSRESKRLTSSSNQNRAARYPATRFTSTLSDSAKSTQPCPRVEQVAEGR